jgi:hypothetical protein
MPPSPTRPGYSHGRNPLIDPRAARARTNVSEPFSIGGNKTAMYHRANPDGSISPVVDKALFPDMKAIDRPQAVEPASHFDRVADATQLILFALHTKYTEWRLNGSTVRG